MSDDFKVEEFKRVVYCDRDVDYTADLAGGVIHVCSGLSPEQYIRIGAKLQTAINEDQRIIPLLHSTET